jgi:hypothetical protein
VGWYNVIEAKVLLARLDQGGVDFYIETPHIDPVNGNAIAAAHGGSFGSSSQVLLYVRREDMEKFKTINDPAFLGEEEPVRKTSFLEWIRSFGLHKPD